MTAARALRLALLEQLREPDEARLDDPGLRGIEAAVAHALRGSRAGLERLRTVTTMTNSHIEFFFAKAGLRLLGEPVPPALARQGSVFADLEALVAAPFALPVVRSTHRCSNTPRVLFALEELGEPYLNAMVPDGWFTARFDVPGPTLEEESGLVVVEIGAVLRHVARAYGDGALLPGHGLAGLAEMDRWLDFYGRRLARTIEPVQPDKARTLLARLDQHLATHTWILGDTFTIADCTYGGLPGMRDRLPLDGLAHVNGFLDRLAARPTLARALARVP